MTRFLKQLAWFGVGILCINAVLWLISREVLFADYRAGFAQLEGSPYRALLLGDSHVEALAQTNLDERILNASFASDSPPEMLVKLLYALEAQPDLKTVFLQADDHMLNAYRLQLNNKKRVVEFSSFASYHQAYNSGRMKYLWEKYVENYFPIVAVDRSPLFQRMLHGAISRVLARVLRRGSAASYREADWSQLNAAERHAGARERIEKHFATEQSAHLEAVYREIVQIARARGIRLVGIKYPLTPEYRDLAAARFAGRPVADILRGLGIDVFDFAAVYDDKPEFFKDADHLSMGGARAFSPELVALLESRRNSQQSERFSYGSAH